MPSEILSPTVASDLEGEHSKIGILCTLHQEVVGKQTLIVYTCIPGPACSVYNE